MHDRLEAEGDDFHEAVRQHFLALAAADPDRYLVVDATLAPGEIHALVRGPAARRRPRTGGGRVSVWDDVIGQPDAVATLAPRRSPTPPR